MFLVSVPESIRSIDDFIEAIRAIWSATKWMRTWGYVPTDFVKDEEATPALRLKGKIILIVHGMDNPVHMSQIHI